jgi:hypothetical protein
MSGQQVQFLVCCFTSAPVSGILSRPASTEITEAAISSQIRNSTAALVLMALVQSSPLDALKA